VPAHPLASRTGADPRRGGLVAKVLRYAGGSVVATGCSELTLVVLYGFLHVPPVWSTCLAWVAGAVPNYWLNRSWTWRRRGRPSLRHEVVPYVVIVLVTLVLATLATRAVDAALKGDGTSSTLRVALVAGSFLAVYAAMFVIRFFLFDRLFAGLADVGEQRTGLDADRDADPVAGPDAGMDAEPPR
jgi:putative flippase GtrA